MPFGVFQSFIPWLLYFILAGTPSIRDEIAAGAGFIAVVIFGYRYLRRKSLLDWATLIYFIVLFLLYFFIDRAWLGKNALLLSSAVLAGVMWISLLILRPFTMIYAQEKVESILWETPLFKHINYTLSAMWAITLTLIALDSAFENINILSSVVTTDTIIAVLLIFAIWFTGWFPKWYRGFVFRRLSQHKEDITKNPYLQNNYAPVHNEIFVPDLPVDGEIPVNLMGVYMRNGPNPAFSPISYTYPIDGDGMLHALYFNQGRVNYRNRFVNTKGLAAERKVGYALYGGIKKPIPTDPKLVGKNGDPGPVKDGAFIHIIRHATQYMAMYEAGPAYQVASDLNTLGEWCPKHAKAPFNVNAHTRLDPRTGELVAFTYALQAPYLSYFVIDPMGALTKNKSIDKPYPSMIHDMILTENFLVFFDCPAIFNLSALTTGGRLLDWQPEKGVTIILVHRKTDEVMRIETEPFFVYHFANGFEQNQQIIVDYVRHDRLALGEELKLNLEEHPPRLYRAIIDLTIQTVTHQPLNDDLVEFPRINDALTSKPHRYIYLATKTTGKDNTSFNALMKFDVQNQQAMIHHFGHECEVGEAVFIPKPNPQSEDDGYAALFIYHKKTQKSQFVLLSATAWMEKPLAIIHLPQRVPHGLHGSWMPGAW